MNKNREDYMRGAMTQQLTAMVPRAPYKAIQRLVGEAVLELSRLDEGNCKPTQYPGAVQNPAIQRAMADVPGLTAQMQQKFAYGLAALTVSYFLNRFWSSVCAVLEGRPISEKLTEYSEVQIQQAKKLQEAVNHPCMQEPNPSLEHLDAVWDLIGGFVNAMGWGDPSHVEGPRSYTVH